MNRIDRLIGIILFLQGKRLVQASEIAEHFNKSIRTIYRDIQSLSEAGLPIAAEPGEGYSLIKGYYLPPLTLTSGEASALLLGTEFVIKKADFAFKKDARSALLKIKSILKEDTKEYINEINKSTIVFNQGAVQKSMLSKIQNSIAENFVVHLKYFSLSKNEITDRDIEPMGLIHYGDNWRIIAYCRLRKDFREFRINRVKSIIFLDEKFTKKKDFSLSDFISKEYQIKNPVEIKIWFDIKTSRFVKEKYSQGLIKEDQVKDGVKMSFLFSEEKLDDITNWVLSFHKSAKALSPLSFQKNVVRKANELIDFYK